jgi:hypothetical protein
VTETEKLQQRYDALVVGFLEPLLSGGTVIVDRPLAPGGIEYYQHAGSSDANASSEIFDRLHRSASAIAPITTVPWPDRDLILLAIAAHNLVLVTDPMLDRVFARGARKKMCEWIDEAIEMVAPPRTRASALARHALLDPLVSLRRKDVVVKNWAYTYRFYGRPVPRNVVMLPKVRFVKQTETLVDIETLWSMVDQSAQLGIRPRLRELLSRSPVTELVRLDLCDDFRFGLATLAVLSDDAIRGGIARVIVERGEWKTAGLLGRALGDPLLHHAPPAHLYYALALCFEVQMTATLDVPGLALPQTLNLSDPDVARYAAVLPAFFEDETMLDEVRAFDDADRGEVQERCDRLSAALPPAILQEVGPLVRRCQRPAPRAPLANSLEVSP